MIMVKWYDLQKAVYIESISLPNDRHFAEDILKHIFTKYIYFFNCD